MDLFNFENMELLLNVLILAVGVVALIYGANKLVDGGAVLAFRLNIPNIVIGLTVVAFGTSMPELVVNIISSVEGQSALVLGNVMGSNIFNILAIAGITAMIYPLRVKHLTTWVEIPLALLAAVLLLLMLNDGTSGAGQEYIVTRPEGVTLLCFFVTFLLYTLMLGKKGEAEKVDIKPYSVKKAVLFVVVGLVGLIIGGRLLVLGAVNIAETLGLSQRIIGLTIVSIGTSLPELATSLVAARKKNVDMAIGNVVGSNIFNVFLVLGASAVINPVATTADSMLDIIVNIIASFLLFIFIFTGKGRQIGRWEGVFFVMLYVTYLVLLILGTTFDALMC